MKWVFTFKFFTHDVQRSMIKFNQNDSFQIIYRNSESEFLTF